MGTRGGMNGRRGQLPYYGPWYPQVGEIVEVHGPNGPWPARPVRASATVVERLGDELRLTGRHVSGLFGLDQVAPLRAWYSPPTR